MKTRTQFIANVDHSSFVPGHGPLVNFLLALDTLFEPSFVAGARTTKTRCEHSVTQNQQAPQQYISGSVKESATQRTVQFYPRNPVAPVSTTVLTTNDCLPEVGDT